jgi:3-oxoacyl-[acyl-carrier protein] reductase
MIVVVEVWHLKPGLEARALEIMQEMDDIVEAPAHLNPGWCDHAHFYQSARDPTRVLMVYPWRSRESHEELAEREAPLLAAFHEKYCTRPRELQYHHELAVEHED